MSVYFTIARQLPATEICFDGESITTRAFKNAVFYKRNLNKFGTLDMHVINLRTKQGKFWKDEFIQVLTCSVYFSAYKDTDLIPAGTTVLINKYVMENRLKEQVWGQNKI